MYGTIASFDEWRDKYDQMDYQAQREFNDIVAVKHPVQIHFTYDLFAQFLAGIPDLKTVVEVGGWRGELADSILPNSTIQRWTNYEIAELETVCFHQAYDHIIPGDFVWNIELPAADVFIASHVIEHIKAAELEALIANLNVKYAALEAPLTDHPTDWTTYGGSHILEVGWDGVAEIMNSHGFELILSQDEFKGWKRAD